MPTAGDLVDEAVSQLHGWGSSQDQVTSLATPMTAGDTQFKVDATFGQSIGITPGMCEIGSEQVYISSADANTGTCQVTPFGRGYGGTTAVPHAAGVMVVTQPKFPRLSAFKQMNEVLGGLFPDLFAVGTKTGLAFTFPSDTYVVSSDMRWAIDVSWQDVGGTNDWIRVRRWRVDPYDNTLRIGDTCIPRGVPLRVMYAKEPGLLQAESDDFEITTGLPRSSTDLLTIGAVMRLVPGLDISRAQLSSVEQSDRSRVVPPNAGLTASKYLYGLYQDRLHNESRALRRRYPVRLARSF